MIVLKVQTHQHLKYQTNNCTKAQKLRVVEMNVHWCRKQKELLSDEANSTQKSFHGQKHRNLNANDKQILEFVLKNHKNGLPIT
jgi:hypothetical protein